MQSPARIGHELAVTARFAGRALARRLRGQIPAPPDRDAFEQRCRDWLAGVEDEALAETKILEVPANRPPWLDTGIEVAAGEAVSWFAVGRVYLSAPMDVWVAPHFQLWARVGEGGEVFRGTRDTHSFTATAGGRLYLASYFPGEWASRDGGLATDPKDYRKTSGGMRVLLLRWRPGTDPAAALARLVAAGAPPELAAEAERPGQIPSPPAGWQYLWFLGDSEIYTAADADPAAIRCQTQGDVGILQYDADLPLTPDMRLFWDWRVEALPSDLAEDTVPTHDYLSIAIEFDNGQDITWYWSAELPPETIYRCPLPTWKARETHIVIRSGREGLGAWHSEARNVYDDCIRALGAPAGRIVRVWLIATSLFQRQRGACSYRNIRLAGGGQAIDIPAEP